MRTAIMLALLSLALAANAADTEQPKVNTGQPTSDGGKEDGKSVPVPASQPASSKGQPSPAARRSTDRLELDTTVVTGNRELPKVLYIVPWKKADIGDLPAQPFNTLLDEALTPIDRDVFRREVTYYGAVSSGANAPASPAAGPEK